MVPMRRTATATLAHSFFFAYPILSKKKKTGLAAALWIVGAVCGDARKKKHSPGGAILDRVIARSDDLDSTSMRDHKSHLSVVTSVYSADSHRGHRRCAKTKKCDFFSITKPACVQPETREFFSTSKSAGLWTASHILSFLFLKILHGAVG